MIQEIYPQRLYNEFVPGRQARQEDFVICVKDKAMLMGGSPGQMCLPRVRDIREKFTYIYLFSVDERAFFLAGQEGLEPLPGFSYLTIREMRRKLRGPLPLMYAAFTAWHLVTWYRDNRFCGRCGHSTRHGEKERSLICPACGNVIYPRLIPAVIVGVTHGDEILMTRYANRDIPYYALVAGFTEIGETLEECVAREVREETGLAVKNIRYYKSQPWGSVQDILMGFYCDVDGDPAIRLDRQELKEGVWVKRQDIEGQDDDWSLTHQMMMIFKEGREPR